MTLTRRNFIAGSASALGIAGCHKPVGQSLGPIGGLSRSPTSLHAVAQRKGLSFGIAAGYKDMADPNIRRLIKMECGILGAENAFKWKHLHKEVDKFDFSRADELVGFAKQNDMLARGHALVWTPDKNMPEWTRKLGYKKSNIADVDRLLKNHIDTVCAHFGNDISTWDVVNEAIVPKTGNHEPGLFFDVLGEDYIELAFHYAKAAVPQAKLVYNDYMRWSTKMPRHHIGVLRILERLRKRDVPIDTLGIQSHLRRFPDTEDDRSWREFLKEVSDMGYEIALTELDVRDKGLPADITLRDQMVADHTKHFLDITLDSPAVKEVMTWGISDKYTVRQRVDKRLDDLPSRSLPFDDKYKAKLMRTAIAAAFEGASAR